MSFSDPFYMPDYFKYQLEILMLESDDLREYEEGVGLLTKKAYAGDTDAMMVLGRHFHNGKYRDIYTALKWYIRAVARHNWEGWDRLQRLYAHPEDEETERAVERLTAEGYDLSHLCQLWEASKGESE